MQNNYKNKQGGFLQFILLILIALVILKILGLTLSDGAAWFRNFFGDVLR